MLGKDGSHISKWEKGVNEPSTENVRQLAAALQVSIDELWADTLYNSSRTPDATSQEEVPYESLDAADPELRHLLHVETYLERQLRSVRSQIFRRRNSPSEP